jgi:hypothetical protein
MKKFIDKIVYYLTVSTEQKYKDIARKKQAEYFKYIQEQSYNYLQNRKY